MTTTTFIDKINKLAKRNEAFFFLFDFEKQKPLVFSSQEALEQNILFDVNGCKNYTTPNHITSTVKVKIDPVAFKQYKKASEDWAKTKYRHIYTHHVHHKTSKDIGKVNIESLRSASGTDSWHDRNGYRSIKAIEGFLHDPEHGQIARISHIF